MSNAPLWEASKENAAPLERGRNVRALEQSFQQDSQEERREKERMIQHYEALVRPSEQHSSMTQNDDDPLIHWLSYIKFHQEAFPSDTHAQFLLMERCTRALLQYPQYQNDVRFIRVCVTYADKTSFPGDVFKYLHQHKVGTQTALFWMAWAWVAESKGDYEFAEKVFVKGIQKQAKPLEKLQQRHKQFQRRFAKYLLKQQQEEVNTDEEQDDGDYNRRGTLHGLTEERVRRNDRSVMVMDENTRVSTLRSTQIPASVATFTDRTVSDRRADRPDLNTTNTAGFSIFVDDSTDATGGYNLDHSHGMEDEPPRRYLERDTDRRKENEGDAERWNDRGGLNTATTATVEATRRDPSFPVYMDDECAAKQQRLRQEERAQRDRARQVRDERTLQQRTEQDIAETLTRDPMRYVRHPSKLAAEQPHVEQEEDRKQSSTTTLKCGFDKRLVGRDSRGYELCFEEGRARAHYFCIVDSSIAFNLLATVGGGGDSTMDVSMSEEDSSTKQTPKALFSSMDSGNLANISTASSTVNERCAVGVPTTKEEETINTKLAMKELSMMFSSPAMGLNDLESAMEHDVEEDGDTATFSLVAGLVDEEAANNSILQDENDGPRNPDARDSALPDFHDNALRMLEGDPQDDGMRGVAPVGSTARATAGFSIYCDDDDNDASADRTAGFQIYQDNRDSMGDTATFSILGEALKPAPAAPAAANTTSAGGFHIYQDDEEKRYSAGDTATFSVLGDALKASPVTASATPFRIHKDNDDEKRSSGGDTATFSVFDEAIKTTDMSAAGKGGFSIYADDDNSIQDSKTDDFQHYKPQTMASPEFGDISRIVADDHDLTFRRLVVPSQQKRESEEALVVKEAHYNYSKLHKDDIRLALRQLQVEARDNAVRGVTHPRDTDLARVLSTKDYVDDLPKQSMPRALLQSKSAKGCKIVLGDRIGIIKEELGKGAYGKVVLLDSKDDDNVGDFAVKAQAPTDCLALEYMILKAVEERVGPHCEGRFPFPNALSFVSVANGGLLGMTNGSQSGINLVDLVNVYKVLEDTPIPELIAMHYTILMLKIIESLHWHGKILHCDAKPDNWVLSSSDNAFEGCSEEIKGSGLMLVDFGRAVDLKGAAKPGMDAMDVLLEGSATEQDMECVAMRKGLAWSFDADTFGLCAGAHVLLYGSHIEIYYNSTTQRWMPRKPLRRYWKKDLWTEFFDTLLNLDEVSKTAIGSRPGSVRDLRKKLEAHVRARTSELESLLRHQARILPSQRIT